MKHVSRIAALILAVLVFCTGCGSSVAPDKYKTTVAATYGDQTTYLDEANFWMRLNQWGTESYTGVMYRYYYGITDIWPIASGVRTQTFEQTLKENTMAEILQTYILLEHAGDYASSALTDSDNEKIAALIADIRDGYADEFFTLAGVADGEAGDAQMKAYFEKRVQAYKVARAVMDQAQVSVKDEDCKSFRIAYILVPEEKKTTTESTASTEGSTSSTDPVGEALANVIRSNLVAGKTWAETKEAWKDLTSNEVTYAYTEESSSIFFTEGKDMKTGDSKVSYKEGTGWYVLYCVSDDDAEGAKTRRATLESEQQTEHFNGVYKTWQDAAKAFKVAKEFKNLTVESAYVAKTTTAAPTTAAPSTAAPESTEATTAAAVVDK